MLSARRLLVWLLMGLVLLPPASAWARKVDGLRLGLHPDHTRLVVDLDGPFDYRLELEEEAGDRVVIYFQGADLAPNWPASKRGLGRVDRVKATNEEGRVKLEVFLTGPSRVQPLTWKGANRLVLDISPQSDTVFEAAEAGQKEAEEAKSKPAVAAKVVPQKVPKTIGDTLHFLLTGQKVIMPAPGISAQTETLLPRPAGEEAPSLAKTEGTVGAEPVPTTLGLTVPIRPLPEAAGGPAIEQAVPGPVQTEIIPDVAAQAKAMAVETKGGPEANLALAKEITTEGLELFKGGYYQEALSQFQRVEPLAPGSDLAKEVLYYQADCLYQLHRQTGLPSFDQVENAYQKAMGAWPQAPAAPRALLRMGLVNFLSDNPSMAQGYFNLILGEHPQTPEAVTAKVYLGRLLLDKQSLQEAVGLFREVIHNHPDSPDIKMAYWYLGRVLFEVGRYVEADQQISELVKRWPDFYLEEPSILYYQGEIAFRLDRLEEARNYLYRVINIQPQIANQDLILARIGDIYKLQRSYRKAATLYTEAEHRFPDSDGALISRIRLAEIQGLDEGQAERLARVFDVETAASAVATYEQIAQKYPDKAVAQLALLKLGAWHYHQEDYLKAFEVLKDLLDRYPDTEFYRDAVFALRQSFDQEFKKMAAAGEPLKTIEFYESFKDALPREIQRRYTTLLAQAYLDINAYAEALRLFELAATQGEAGPEVILGLVLSNYYEGRFDQAIKAMDWFLKQYPAHGQAAEVRFLLGQSLFQLGRFAEAAGAFQDVATKTPDSPQYWPAVARWAESLAKIGRWEESVVLLKKALSGDVDPERQSELFALLGDSLTALGRNGEAIEAFAQAASGLRVEDDASGVYYRLAQAYLSDGQVDKAKAILNQLAESGEAFWAKMAADRLMLMTVSAEIASRKEAASP